MYLYHHHDDCAYTNAGNTICTVANPTEAVSFDTMGFAAHEYYLAAATSHVGAAVFAAAALLF